MLLKTPNRQADFSIVLINVNDLRLYVLANFYDFSDIFNKTYRSIKTKATAYSSSSLIET